MHDPLSEQSSFRRAWRDWMGQAFIGWRILLGLIFVAMLTFFLHFREIKVEVLEINSIAQQYVIAQVPFDFPDDELTLVLRQQASRDVGSVYQFDSKQIHQMVNAFEEHLIRDPSWRKTLPKSTFEEVYEAVESLEEYMLETRFADSRTLQKMHEMAYSSDNFYEVSSEKNRELIDASYWNHLEEVALPPSRYPKDLANTILLFFSRQHWSLQQDIGLERRLKQYAQDSVPQQYTQVLAGSHIIDPGEKVTLKHVMMLQAMKNALGNSRNLWSYPSMIGSVLLSLMIALLTAVYLKIYHAELFRSFRKLTLLAVIAILTLLLAKATEFILLYKGHNLIEVVRFPLVVPFASLLLCVLLGARIALFSSIFLSVIISVGLTFEYDRFLILNLIASMCTIMFARSLHKRKEVFEVCGKVFLACMPVLFSFNLVSNTFVNVDLLADVMCTFGFMTVTAILVVGLLPLFETTFKVVTDMTLMEYMDPNNELLRRLSLEAPGTYQHCLVVGTLAEAAARAIGANDLFCRVATLYHDIGKLFNPHYFTENQLGGFNIHQLLTPLESTHVIISHVSEGEALAKKYHLPQSFIDVIREHHGTTLVYYFYCKQIEQMEGDASKVNEKLFRYPGPKPHTKESALIMIADTVEATSRSLDEVTEEILQDMVDKLVSEKAEEGQFDECQLTFEELGTVKKAIVRALLVTRHLRVKYPSRV